jgi:hypothetical protein
MHRRLGRSFVTGSALVLLACGSGDGGNESGKLDGGLEEPRPGHFPLSSDMQRFIRGVCGKTVECPNADLDAGPSLEQCVTLYESLYCQPAFETLALPGIDACLAALTCDHLTSSRGVPPAACSEIIDALTAASGATLLGVGESCDLSPTLDSALCAPGSDCRGELGACGICTANLPDGAACQDHADCLSIHCGPGGTCQPPLPDGSDCEDDEQCRNYCVDRKCGTREVSLGGDCTSSVWCEGGAFCADGKCIPRFADGATCTDNEQCAFACIAGKCAPNSACGAGGEGEACFLSDNCEAGLICAMFLRRCTAPKAAGEACEVDALECVDSTYCATDAPTDPTGTCQPTKAAGAACESGRECESWRCSDEGECDAVLMCDHSMRTMTSAARPATMAVKQRSTAASARPSMVSLVRYSPSLPQRR